MISGEAGIALILEGADILSLTCEGPENIVQRSGNDVLRLLMGATDIEYISAENLDGVRAGLRLSRNRSTALPLILGLLEPGQEPSLALKSAEHLEALLADHGVMQHIENRLYSAPLPASVDRRNVADIATLGGGPNLTSLLRRLDERQDRIARVALAWKEASAHIPEDHDIREILREALIMQGIFLRLATTETNQEDLSLAIEKAFERSGLAYHFGLGLSDAHRLATEWCARLGDHKEAPVARPSRTSYLVLDSTAIEGFAAAARKADASVRNRRSAALLQLLRAIEPEPHASYLLMREACLPLYENLSAKLTARPAWRRFLHDCFNSQQRADLQFYSLMDELAKQIVSNLKGKGPTIELRRSIVAILAEFVNRRDALALADRFCITRVPLRTPREAEAAKVDDSQSGSVVASQLQLIQRFPRALVELNQETVPEADLKLVIGSSDQRPGLQQYIESNAAHTLELYAFEHGVALRAVVSSGQEDPA